MKNIVFLLIFGYFVMYKAKVNSLIFFFYFDSND